MKNETSGRLVGNGQVAQRVCILSGSLGAVSALRRFFTAIDAVLPVAFIVAIPTAPDIVPLLCNFIAPNTPMRVLPALSGHTLCHGDILVVPSNRVMQVDEDKKIQLVSAVDGVTNPVDDLMRSLSSHFGPNLGAIVFSGLGEDGQQGCGAIARQGGEVWTQSVESCQFQRLPQHINRTCKVGFSAVPENLGVRLQSELRVISRYQAQQLAAAKV